MILGAASDVAAAVRTDVADHTDVFIAVAVVVLCKGEWVVACLIRMAAITEGCQRAVAVVGICKVAGTCHSHFLT